MINPIKALQFSAISGLCSLGVVAGDVAVAAEVNINPVPEAQQAELLAQTATIVEVAAGDERFSTLVTAVEAAADAAAEAVRGYEPGGLTHAYRKEADLADRMPTLIEAGQRRQAEKH